MLRNRTKNAKRKTQNYSVKFKVLKTFEFCAVVFTFYFLLFTYICAQGEFTYDAKGKRNPFISLVTSDGRLLNLDAEKEDKSALLLEGIIYDKRGLSYAIVNGTVVRIGDTAGDYQVLKIEERKVILIKAGQVHELELKKEEP